MFFYYVNTDNSFDFFVTSPKWQFNGMIHIHKNRLKHFLFYQCDQLTLTSQLYYLKKSICNVFISLKTSKYPTILDCVNTIFEQNKITKK